MSGVMPITLDEHRHAIPGAVDHLLQDARWARKLRYYRPELFVNDGFNGEMPGTGS